MHAVDVLLRGDLQLALLAARDLQLRRSACRDTVVAVASLDAHEASLLVGREPPFEEVRRRTGVLVAFAAEALRHAGREALVVELDGDPPAQALAQLVGPLA